MLFVALALAALPVVPHEAAGVPLKLIFIGDTGRTPDNDGCAWRPDGTVADSCHITPAQLADLRAAIRAEAPDAIYALGDLVYWRAPACKKPTGRDLSILDASVGAPLGGLDAPVYLVLGNHDLAQRHNAPRRARCMMAYAAQHPDLNLVARQYVVEHGLADVLVVDTNRKRTMPGEALDARASSDRWLLVAAHHPLRVAFDKDDAYSRTMDMNVPRWLAQHTPPDLWASGHAHLLQFGTYDVGALADGEPSGVRVPALVSGAGSKVRPAPTCGGVDASEADQAACVADDPRGMPDASFSRFGFAVVELTAEQMTLRLVDERGQTLHHTTVLR